MRRILFFILLLSTCSVSRAQQTADPDTIPFFLMSLEQLMNVNVTVASQLPMTSRESPGIVTILNHEEIVNSGANDLIQLLQQVPGFDFGVDVEGVVGIGIRGNWAHEGKVLMLWDGMEMNEDLYSTLQFGNHYPLDQVKKIEIIRGPGSAIYGGNAEYAVINITTINSKDFNGVAATATGSWMSKTYANRGVTVAAGQTFGMAHINLSTSLSEGTRSQRIFTDAMGNSYDMTDQSGLSNGQYRMDFYLKGLSVTGMYENYNIEQRDGYGSIYNRAYKTEFNSGFVNAKYDLHPTEKLSVTPGFKLKIQYPWKYSEAVINDNFYPFNTSVTKKEYFINGSYDPVERINISGGVQYYNQNAHELIDTLYFSNSTHNLLIDNYAAFAQAIFKLKPLNIILGSRYEYNTSYGPSFVPRIGITRVRDNYHFKALYCRAFRAPSIENINLSPDIEPEKTTVFEFESGIKIAQILYLTANVYNITTLNPIIYYYDDNENDAYKNESSTGSRGFDIDCKWKFNGWYASLSYSYNTTAGHQVVHVYQVPGHEGKVLAFPTHEVSLNGNIQISQKISLSPSFTYMAERFCYHEDESGLPASGRYAPALFLNLNLSVSDVFCKGLMLQAGCFNATNNETLFIQPYNGMHCPLPGQDRQFQLKLRYNISFSER